MPKVSIIIPTLNEQGYITSTLEHCLAQTSPADEIIVIDAGSIDATAEQVARFPEVKFISSQGPVGSQRDSAGRLASGDILVFLDADVLPPKDFIARAVAVMEKKQLDLACPLYWPERSTFPIQAVYVFFCAMFVLFQFIAPSGAGSGILVRKQLFNRVDGFEGRYKFDDIAFIRKAARQGKFRMLWQWLPVSDRRFRQYGAVRMFLLYLLLSPIFILGLFGLSNWVNYTFGQFSQSKR